MARQKFLNEVERGRVCEHCRWFKRSGLSAMGLCRIDAPTHNVPAFPIVNTDWWCGKFEPGASYYKPAPPDTCGMDFIQGKAALLFHEWAFASSGPRASPLAPCIHCGNLYVSAAGVFCDCTKPPEPTA